VTSASPISFAPGEVSSYYAARLPNLKQTRAPEWRGACPLHHGLNDNFAVDAETGRWFCHSECGRGGDVFDLEAELSGGDFPACKSEVFSVVGRTEPEYQHGHAGTNGKARRTIAEIYDYTDAGGGLLYQAVRYAPKGFSLRRPNGRGDFIPNMDGVTRVPYRLPKLLTAQTVHIPEGEKDVHSLESWGLVASCNSEGAGKFKPELAHYFTGKNIVIVPDNDKAGREHAAAVIDALWPVVATIRVVELPGLPDKGDVTAWQTAGGTFEQFKELTVAAALLDAATLSELRTRWGLAGGQPKPPGAPMADRGTAPQAKALAVRSMDQHFDDPDQVEDPLITGLLYPGLTMLHGAPKAGKTFLAIQIAKALITGETLADYFSVNYTGPVLYLSEMSENQLRARTKRIGLNREQHARLLFVDVHSILPWTGGGAEQLEQTIAALEPRPVLLIADSLLGIIKATERGGSVTVQEYAIGARFKAIADRFNLPTLLLHHSRKMAGDPIESAMGTGGITAAPDDIWALKREPEHECTLTCEGRACETRTYRWRQGAEGFWEIVDSGPSAVLGPVRRRILEIVTKTPNLHGRQIAERLDMNDSTVRTHLQYLAEAGAVLNGRRGYVALDTGPGLSNHADRVRQG